MFSHVQHPLHVYGYGFLLSVTGYLGLNILLTLLRVAGAFAVVTVSLTIFLFKVSSFFFI